LSHESPHAFWDDREKIRGESNPGFFAVIFGVRIEENIVKISVRFIMAFLTVFGIFATLVPASEAVINIMPLGDSITRGFSGSTDQTGYRRYLYLTLTGEGYDIDFVGSLFEPIPLPDDFDRDHEGHSGWSTDEILNGRPLDPSAGNLAIWLPESEPDIILLHIGTNDISEIGYDQDQSLANVAAILDAIDDYEDDFATPIWVLLARIINRNCITENPPCIDSEKTTDFNDSVEIMAQDRIFLLGDKIRIVDMEEGVSIFGPIDYRLNTLTPPGDMSDNLHPFDTGYDKMADLWFSAIQQVTIPVASAVADPTNPKENTEVTLDGSNSSDADGTIVSYQWVQTAGTNTVNLSDDTAVTPTFTAPEVDTTGDNLTFELTVIDNDGFESSDTVSVNVIDRINPIAVADADPTNPKEFTEVTLDGSHTSDPDATIVSYLWEQLPGGTRVMLTIPPGEPAKATFTAPEFVAPGEPLTFELTVVTDNDGFESSATVSVNVVDRINPVAVADADPTTAKETTEVTLDGSNSSDPDGTIVSFKWVQTAGINTVTLSDDTAATPTFTAPEVDANGDTLTFQLTVTDDDGLSDSDTVNVNVSDGTVASTDGGGGGGGGGCFITVASEGVPLQSYVTGLGNTLDRTMISGNPIFMLILFVLYLCAGICLKYALTVQGFRGSGFKG